MRSGIILAGGRSTRFGGGDKSLKPVDGKPMICRVRDTLGGVVGEVILSVRNQDQQARVSQLLSRDTFALDEVPDIGPLAGVQAALKAAAGEYVALVACDMPFLNGRAVELLFEKAAGHDAAVPVSSNGFLEPLHAVYRREPMLRAVDESIKKGERRIAAPLTHLKDVVYVPAEELERVDPGLKTFLNINRADDLPR